MKNHLLTWSAAFLAMTTLAACGGSKPTPTPTPSKDSEQGTSIVSSDSEEETSEEGTSEEDTSEEATSEGTSEEATSEETTSEEAATIEVTFKLTVHNLGSHTLSVAGEEINSWSTTATPLTSLGNDVYSFSFSAEAGTTISYKYVLDGSDWATLNPGYEGTANRTFTYAEGTTEKDDGEITLPTADLTVTFKLTVHNLGNRTISVAGKEINDWNATATPLKAEGNDVYSFSFASTAGATIEYKYVLDGSDWASLNPGYTGTANRTYTYTAGITEQDDGEITLTPIGDTDVTTTFTVDMTSVDLTGKNVFIRGSFADGGWNTGIQLTPSNDNLFMTQITKKENETIEFKFVTVDGEGTVTWELDQKDNRTYTFDSAKTTVACVWNVA